MRYSAAMRGWMALMMSTAACSFSPPEVGAEGVGGGDGPRALDAPAIADAIRADARPDAPPPPDASTAAGADAGCPARATVDVCTSPRELGAVSGDSGSDVLTAHGHGNASFAVEVREDYGGNFDADPIAQIDLDSPPGADFDLQVFCFGGCAGAAIASSDRPSGERDGVGVGQEDRNNTDNGFRLWLDIHFWGGSDCGDWTLTVQGNRATSPVSCY